MDAPARASRPAIGPDTARRPGAPGGNNVITQLDASGAVCIFTLAATDLIVDVNGYFGWLPSPVIAPARFSAFVLHWTGWRTSVRFSDFPAHRRYGRPGSGLGLCVGGFPNASRHVARLARRDRRHA